VAPYASKGSFTLGWLHGLSCQHASTRRTWRAVSKHVIHRRGAGPTRDVPTLAEATHPVMHAHPCVPGHGSTPAMPGVDLRAR
jgi:hypothetical protein